MNRPQASMLPDGRRLHLNHGPIDLIVEGFGQPAEIQAAYAQAKDRFDTVLTGLVEELPQLRQACEAKPRPFEGTTARRMEHTGVLFSDRFVTPMAGVAGAVADEVLAAMIDGRRLDRAYVNDGGDIALFLAPGTEMKAAIGGTGHGLDDRVTVRAADPVRGIATSGWRGRSHSLGIADAVTVLAESACVADVAATLIANAVDLPDHPSVGRKPARDLAPDSDLGERQVTISVGTLSPAEIEAALDGGRRVAEEFVRRGLIVAAALFLHGQRRICGTLVHALTPPPPPAAVLRAEPLVSPALRAPRKRGRIEGAAICDVGSSPAKRGRGTAAGGGGGVASPAKRGARRAGEASGSPRQGTAAGGGGGVGEDNEIEETHA